MAASVSPGSEPSPAGSGVAMVIQRFRPRFTGQGVQVEALSQTLARRGVFTTIYTRALPEAPAGVEECDGYRISRLRDDWLPGARMRLPAFAGSVRSALREDRPAVVHVHGLTDGLYGGQLHCRSTGTPLVFEMTLMGDDDPRSVRANPSRPRWLRWRMFKRCDAYVAMSHAFEQPYLAEGLPAERLYVIPQGVDTARFAPADERRRQQARAHLDLPASAAVVAFVGSLIERKGIDVLLAAWETVHAHHPGAWLLLAGRNEFPGDIDDQGYLDAAWARLSPGAQSRVRQLGVRPDVETVLAAADVFALPSRREGFGSVIIEAMASGLPCVVARLEGITDMIFESPANPPGATGDRPATAAESDGFVIPQDDPRALVSAIDALLAHPALSRTLGARARARVLERFDLERVADSYLDLYARLGAKLA